MTGYWYFRDGHVFCTFYDPPNRPAMNGGCWDTMQIGANCFEFYLADTAPGDPDEGDPRGLMPSWNARAWRQDAPSTCHDKPSV